MGAPAKARILPALYRSATPMKKGPPVAPVLVIAVVITVAIAVVIGLVFIVACLSTNRSVSQGVSRNTPEAGVADGRGLLRWRDFVRGHVLQCFD